MATLQPAQPKVIVMSESSIAQRMQNAQKARALVVEDLLF